MHVLFASDLHYGVHPEGDESVRRLAAHATRSSSKDDVLVVVGDIGKDDESLVECLTLFAGFRGRKLAVPGNHDVWVMPGGNSWTRYRGLTALFARCGFHALEDRPYVQDGTAFVGAMGWYDCSFKEDSLRIPDEAYRTKTYPGEAHPLWNDAQYAAWGVSDEEMTAWQASNFERQLRAVHGATEIIAAVHHVPTRKLLFHPRWMVPKRIRFANAFLGSERFGALAARHGATLVVNGHIHLEGTAVIGNTAFVSIGGDYGKKQLLVKRGHKIRRVTFTHEAVDAA